MAKSIKLKNNIYWDLEGLYGLGKFAKLYQLTHTVEHTVTAWTRTKMPINDWKLTTNDSKLFLKEDNCIKCNFKGTVLIIRYASLNVSNQFDIYDSNGRNIEVNSYNHLNIDIRNVDYTSIYFEFQMGATSFSSYLGSRLLILRLS